MRLEMSNRTSLARQAMVILAAGGDGAIKGSQLASRLDTTAHYLPQVMKPLVDRGWLASEPGPTGGYRLMEPGREVSMYELIEAVEGPVDNKKCVLRRSECHQGDPCALHEVWSRARDAMVDELRATKVIEASQPGPATVPNRKE